MKIRNKIKRTNAINKGKWSFTIFLIIIGIVFSGCSNTGIGLGDSDNKVDTEELMALPYLAYVEDDPEPGKKGVTIFNENLSYSGVNILTSRRLGKAHLLDMEGNVLHSWFSNEDLRKNWLYSEIDNDGNLVVLIGGFGLVKLDWNSNVLWVINQSLINGVYHHDFEITEEGDVYILSKHIRDVEYNSVEIPIRENSIVIFDSDGLLKKQIFFYDVVGDQIPEEDLIKIEKNVKQNVERKELLEKRIIDVFHSNTVEEIPRDIGVAKKGDLLFCIRNLNLIGILDVESEEVIWSWGPGILDRPHHPTVLDNGNILVFDNGRFRNYSRVLELNPITREIVWKYEADPPESFFTQPMGANQRLPNGNTLITESNKGRVFEVTMDGEIVWEFWNIEFDEKGRRGTIYRMMRYDRLNRSL
jgi:hypothetical protein